MQRIFSAYMANRYTFVFGIVAAGAGIAANKLLGILTIVFEFS